jgi:mannose-1-phosphate guanylyltransferase / mannose-6-phosphate isomerase
MGKLVRVLQAINKERHLEATAQADLGFTRLAAAPWSQPPDISIEYAVTERAPNLSVVLFGGTWSDLGDWQGGDADETGVDISGSSTAFDCKNTLFYAAIKTQELVAIGPSGIIRYHNVYARGQGAMG